MGLPAWRNAVLMGMPGWVKRPKGVTGGGRHLAPPSRGFTPRDVRCVFIAIITPTFTPSHKSQAAAWLAHIVSASHALLAFIFHTSRYSLWALAHFPSLRVPRVYLGALLSSTAEHAWQLSPVSLTHAFLVITERR